ncbi:MAG: dephospho-CoA kinase [Nitrosomonas sp.]|nr:MAG: dephospho-CoA kinase [Nitrosomonas sp.]
MSFIVGLTGGIGCGKTAVSRFFADLGIDIVDTDVIARELTQPNGSAIYDIKNTFGDFFLTQEGTLNREKMRTLIFSDQTARLKLENILHPLIYNQTVLQIARARSLYIIVVIPLLFETKLFDKIMQRILVVDCDEQVQVSRTMARSNLPEQQVKSIIATQISRTQRLQKADDIITNNQGLDYLKAQVSVLHEKYLLLSNLKSNNGNTV